jgi:hypothetical protein
MIKGVRSSPSAPPVPRYAEAVEATRVTIHRRSVFYRNLIIALTLAVAASAMGAVVWWSALPLLGLLLLPPLCAAFLFLDSWTVCRWRWCILELWAEGALELDAFRQAVTAVRALPAATLAAMLEPLPRLVALGHPTSPWRGRWLLARILHAIDLNTTSRAAAVAVGAASIVAGIIAATVARSGAPLVAAMLVTALAVATDRAASRRRLRRFAPSHAEVRDAGIEPQALASAAATLSWRRVTLSERDELLARIISPER